MEQAREDSECEGSLEGSWGRLSGGVMESSFLEIFQPQPDKALGNLLHLTLLQQRSWPGKPQEVPSSLNHPVFCHPQLLLLRKKQKWGSGELGAELQLWSSGKVPLYRSTRIEQQSGDLPAQERTPWPDGGWSEHPIFTYISTYEHMGYLHMAYVLCKSGPNVSCQTTCLHVWVWAAFIAGCVISFITKVAHFLKYIGNTLVWWR